jgi:3-oxosteroid 1-dehydrogenase
MSRPSWDREVDTLVVGTGGAGLTAAITSADAGLETLVLESTDLWGGSTSLSGGGLWMPTNPLMKTIGVADSTDEALAYMEACIGDVGPASSEERRRAFVESVPVVFRFLQRQGVEWSAATDYPDYYPDLPGGKTGRAIEVKPYDVKKLGALFDSCRCIESGLPPVPLMTDDVWLLARAWSTPDGFARGARLVGRSLWGVVSGKKLYGMGAGLVASLMAILQRQGVPVLLQSPLTELVVDDGVVIGAVSQRADGYTARIKTRRGVVLAAGGFAHNTDWRQKYHHVPGWSSAAEGNTGSAIDMARALGAKLALMDDAWWGLSVPDPEGRKAMFTLAERSMPHSLIVDQQGNRYMNESASYIDVGHWMLERNQTVPAIPSWLIVDATHRRRYMFSALMRGSKKHRAAGIVVKSETIEGLAVKLKMNPTTLRATIERFNGFARTGVDEDFGRGRTAYDNYYGDPSVGPNPNLGTIANGPFTAVQLVPGDLGTKGGLLTDQHARVLDEENDPITGLYASGNTTASVMGRTYPGPGSTIAPAVIFGYLAGRHMAAGEESSRS